MVIVKRVLGKNVRLRYSAHLRLAGKEEPQTFSCLVTNVWELVEKWVAKVERTQREQLVVGIQLHGAEDDVATVQLVVGTKALLFQIARAKAEYTCDALQSFFLNDHHQFVALDTSMVDKLESCGFQIRNVIDAQDLVRSAAETGKLKLRKRNGQRWNRSWKRWARYSDVDKSEYLKLAKGTKRKWNKKLLRRHQIKYTFTQAACAFRLGKRLL